MIGLGTSKKGFKHKFTVYEEFMHSIPPTPYVSNPILLHTGSHTNTCPAGMIVDPLDATKFIFARGEFLGPTTVGSRIRLFTGGTLDDPYDLGTDQGLIFEGSESYDIEGCRGTTQAFVPMGGSNVWYYYTGVDASLDWRICRATSSDGGRTWTKQGVVLDFNGTTEFSVSGPSVFIENGTWYMAYTVWDGIGGTDNNPGDSKVGIWLATSSDGISWTKTGTQLVPLGTLDNVEDCLLTKFGDVYTIIYNCETSTNWEMQIATSPIINVTFYKNKLRRIDGVACPNILRFNDGFDYLFYQDQVAPATNEIFVAKFIPII